MNKKNLVENITQYYNSFYAVVGKKKKIKVINNLICVLNPVVIIHFLLLIFSINWNRSVLEARQEILVAYRCAWSLDLSLQLLISNCMHGEINNEYILYSIWQKYQKVKNNIYMGQTHSWFRLVMNTLIASMEIRVQVTIWKSKMQMTSNLFCWSKIGKLMIETGLRLWWFDFVLTKKKVMRIWFARHWWVTQGPPVATSCAHATRIFFNGIWISIPKSTIKSILAPTAPSS